ncbi:LUD domain-containing protein [Sphingomonas sp. PB2P19]|uniref:LutC/YkgG family protein n=1 Tax=Sphingomonas rhamnosi TaxID=3096156 RepID=UPI002FCC5A2A
MTARDAILARLGGSATPAAIDTEAAALLIAPERPRVDPARLEESFLAMLTLPSVAATVDRIGSPDELPGAVATYLTAQGLPPRLCVPPDPRVAAGDWSGMTLHEQVAPDENAVLAFARCGVAETGSLVFETSPTAPMLPNFLALHHIVVVPGLVAQLEDAMLGDAMPRAHYWVTGVSGTTDIEGTYVRGAHGPRFLHVILLGQLQ